MIEEADAWFEYLEATRGQTALALPRGRALGVGASETAAARSHDQAHEAPPGSSCVAKTVSAGRAATLW